MRTETPARMLAEIHAAAQEHADWARLSLAHAPTLHVAVMSEPFLSYLFDGRKTVESRFSLHNIAPYGKVQAGDIVFVKAGHIAGCFTIAWVKTFDLRDHPIEALAQEYSEAVCGDDAFWESKSSKRYATLIGVKVVQRLTPVAVTKLDRRAWVTL